MQRPRIARLLVAFFAMLTILLVAIAAAAEPGSGLPPEVLDLTPLFQARLGDVPDCSALDADERGALSFDEYKKAVDADGPPSACFRASFARPDWSGPIAVSLGDLDAAWELYANGALVAHSGDIASGHVEGNRKLGAFTIPATALRSDARLTLAVRTTTIPGAYWSGTRSPWKNGLRIAGPSALVDALVRANRAEISGSRELHLLVSVAASVLLAIFQLVLFRSRRKNLEYLHYSLAELFFGAWLLNQVAMSMGVRPELMLRLVAVNHFVLVFAIEGMWWMLRGRPPSRPARAFELLLVAIAALRMLAPSVITRVLPYSLVMLILLGGEIYILYFLVLHVRRSREARTLLAGNLLIFFFFGGQVLATIANLPRHGVTAIFYFGAEIGVVCFSGSMALALAHRFTGSLDALDSSHQELELTYQAAARFVPVDFMRLLGRTSIRDVGLGDQVAMEMSILFCDVRGFSRLAEELGPVRTFSLINSYLRFMEPEIHAHKGFIRQYLGDGIMALFPGTADDAVAAAIGMHAALERFNEEQKQNGEASLVIGIGVNTGPVMLGTIGGRDRLDSGVVGDAVNLASRIEGMTKMYGTGVLLGERTVTALADRSRYALRVVDHVIAKGTRAEIAIWELLDALPKPLRIAREESLPRYGDALEALTRGDFASASEGFAAVVASTPDDRAAVVMADRAAQFVKTPPISWSGVTALSTK